VTRHWTDKEKRHDIDAYLLDMRDSADAISSYVSQLSWEDFRQDRRTQDAVVRRIEVIGEAADRIMKADPTYEKSLPEVPLRLAKDMRNLVILNMTT
jgi:uncharacterized protein with HEPN domain